jgi:alpha-L-rhamnosidase
MIQPTNLKCEYRTNPLGIDEGEPRLSWWLESTERDQRQSAYQVLVATSREELEAGCGTLWDSGRVASDRSTHVAYAGPPLQSEIRCWWKVRVWDQDGHSSQFSEPAWWQMGLLHAEEWRASWISYDTGLAAEMDMRPSPFLRRRFKLDGEIQCATLYATARGLYRVHLNGRKVGDVVLAPDWTDYNQRVLYDTYDVTAFLQPGDNAIGAILGDGWYCGYLGWQGRREHYGRRPQLLVQLHVRYRNGEKVILSTDDTWRATAGPIIFSDLYMGELYDARRELPGWDRPDCDESTWGWATLEQAPESVQLTAQSADSVRVVEQIRPRAVTRPAVDTFILDLGQNIAGWAHLKVAGPAGTRVQLRFGEILNPDGTLYVENLRSARATDVYILKGGDPESYEPHFTYHGFRYVEVTGYPGDPGSDAITGRVIHSAAPQVGNFECSDSTVNRIWRNALWGQRSNFVSIPTDCPQRDERLGWLADAGQFAQTACFNLESAAFFSRWMTSICDAQSEDGAFPDVAPRAAWLGDGAPGWGESALVLPWVLYRTYADTRIIERSYSAMARWMNYIHAANPTLLRTERLNNNYGDWVSYNADTPRDLLATALWAYGALLMAKMAQATGRVAEAQQYRTLFDGIKARFIEAYVSPDGHVRGETQTGYVLALHVGLLPSELRCAAADHLVENIRNRGWHLSTGFLGTASLLPVLTEAGKAEVAYRLLRNDTCPSWGYMIKLGATTMWERWDSLTGSTAEDYSVFDPETPTFMHPVFGPIPGMNSFNHFTFGAVAEWLYRYVAGIEIDPDAPGCRRVIIQPHPGGGLTWAGATYESIRGRVACRWRLTDDHFRLQLEIPANSTATVVLPGARDGEVFEGGRPLPSAPGVHAVSRQGGNVVADIGSGRYDFEASLSWR